MISDAKIDQAGLLTISFNKKFLRPKIEFARPDRELDDGGDLFQIQEAVSVRVKDAELAEDSVDKSIQNIELQQIDDRRL